jgi:hypothetical protein
MRGKLARGVLVDLAFRYAAVAQRPGHRPFVVVHESAQQDLGVLAVFSAETVYSRQKTG